MKEKILKRLVRVSKKNKILRYPMLAVIFLFLGICYLGQKCRRMKLRFCGVMCTGAVFLLSSSFALPILLDISNEAETSATYESELAELLESGTLEDFVIEDDDVMADGFEDYESYDVSQIDTYSTDEILSANEDYLLQNTDVDTDVSADSEQEVPVFQADDWRLVLINKQHPIPDDYSFELTTITGTMQCDARILADLLAMLQAAKEDGVSLVICSPYRDLSKQVVLFERKIKAYMNMGLSYMDAYKITSQAVTVPGASEHQLGLALDIYCTTYTVLDDGFGETEAGMWLAANSHEFGFILRYPQGKEDITGIEYEPWHFRYVGKDAAAVISEEDITLEEFWERYVNS